MQDVIYRIKTAFNADFDELHGRKVRELKCVKDRNRQIGEIMPELDINQELWEPCLTDSECPERVLTVDDSEVSGLVQCSISGDSSHKVHQTNISGF